MQWWGQREREEKGTILPLTCDILLLTGSNSFYFGSYWKTLLVFFVLMILQNWTSTAAKYSGYTWDMGAHSFWAVYRFFREYWNSLKMASFSAKKSVDWQGQCKKLFSFQSHTKLLNSGLKFVLKDFLTPPPPSHPHFCSVDCFFKNMYTFLNLHVKHVLYVYKETASVNIG